MSMLETIVPKSLAAQRTKAKTRAGREADDAPPAIENRFLGDAAEADPVLDSLLEPGQLDTRQMHLSCSSVAAVSR